MIDTMVLTIPRSKYIILDHEKFSPSTKGLFESPYYRLGSRSNFTCKQYFNSIKASKNRIYNT